MNISAYRLAKDIGVSQIRIGQIIAGKRAITVDTGLRLSKYFGLNDSFWSGVEPAHDAAIARDQLADVLAKIVARYPMSRIDDLLPFAYVKPKDIDRAAA